MADAAGLPESQDNGLQVGILGVDPLDIHNGMETEVNKASRSRPLEVDEDNEGFQLVSKKPKVRKLPSSNEKAIGLEQQDSDGIGQHVDGRKTILVKSLDIKERVTCPRKLSSLLNDSPYHKYVVQYSIRNLGNGSGFRFEINDTNGKAPHPEEIQQLGNLKVRCWYPSEQSLKYGKIGPIDRDITDDYLLQGLEVLNMPSKVKIATVKRRRDSNGLPTEQIILGVSDHLPELVAIDNVTFRVTQYTRPPLRCYNCHFFGHGTLTCKRTKRRCMRCGEFHEGLESCSKPYFCIFCKGGHRYSSRECPINTTAREVESKRNTNEITESEARDQFRELNRNVRDRANPATLSDTNNQRTTIRTLGNNDGHIRVLANSRSNIGLANPNPSLKNTLYDSRPLDASFSDDESLADSYASAVKQGANKQNNSVRPKTHLITISSPHRKHSHIRKPLECPPPPLTAQGGDLFHNTVPLTSSNSYNAHISGPRRNDSGSDKPNFFVIIFQVMSQLYNVYCNGKSFLENFQEYYNIVLPVIRLMTEPSAP